MSGFVGLIDLDGAPVDRPLLERMTASMAFRGPDALNVWTSTSGSVGLGHALLKTVADTGADEQPAHLDSDLWIVADARVDGREDLVKALAGGGRSVPFTTPDGELILHAYSVWGDACVDHLIGDFAFAIWDGSKRRLFCARDQFGVKPFLYARVGTQLVVSNTLGPIRLHPGVSDRLNDVAIADFLVLRYNQDAATTTFADVQRLPPAHTLSCGNGVVRAHRYWSLPVGDPIRYRRQSEYVEHFRDIFEQATADRLRTKRAGVFLSGGMDSPSVALSITQSRHAAARSCDLQAYHIAYERIIFDEERKYAGLVAEQLGIPFDVFVADDYPVFAHWDDPACWTAEPRLNPIAAMYRHHYRRVGARDRVVLTGYGSDPLFVYQTDVAGIFGRGTMWQVVSDIGTAFLVHRRLPPVGIRTTLRQLRPTPATPLPIPSWINPVFAREMNFAERYRARMLPVVEHVHPVRAEAQREMLHRRWTIHFELQDPGITGFPIEFRYPFFDTRVVNYILSIPPVPWSQHKELLRSNMRTRLPESIWARPKAPLGGSPVDVLCREEPTRQRLRSLVTTSCTKYFREGTFPVDLDAHGGDDVWTALRPLALEYWIRWAKKPGA
jgi:asparagine synthase (glutamine-hydrolysing)